MLYFTDKKSTMNRPVYLFLIGGSDLEMLAIKRLLTAHGFAEGQNLADRHLAWGAKLSDYKNLFNDTQTFVGIELTQDIEPPPHYINIDHHNEYSYKPSSLEQVIELHTSIYQQAQHNFINCTFNKH